MPTRPLHVLFLCTGNSARSMIAEAVLNRLGRGSYIAHSAGSHPRDSVHPMAIATLEAMGLSTRSLRSKSWAEFAAAGGPVLDFVFTVCDNAAGESCPSWPGAPLKAHWGIPDPAAVTGSAADQRAAFIAAYHALEARIREFLTLPVGSMGREELQAKLHAIGAR